ncbi:hypothetical protein IW262DRAFT_1276992 [Armillaria fumosa]|nr:hypothetical protein IW262DRAFT_1276992 [Armillaria fumosa]
MTDYCSQSKTRPWNPVDLNNCRSYQSYYTALSRSVLAEGTLIFSDYTGHNLKAFDTRKIQGMCSGHLRQEFRELEVLDYITCLQYNSQLPDSISGDCQYTLIDYFQSVFRRNFVSETVD